MLFLGFLHGTLLLLLLALEAPGGLLNGIEAASTVAGCSGTGSSGNVDEAGGRRQFPGVDKQSSINTDSHSKFISSSSTVVLPEKRSSKLPRVAGA